MADDPLNVTTIEAALADFKDPETGRSALQMEQLRDIELKGDGLALTLALTTHSAPIWKDVQDELESLLRTQFPQLSSIDIRREIFARPPQKLGEIGLTAKSVIAVGSGKGGVGKSTIAVTLAMALQRAGAKVGLMDADVYGPSVPHLMGITEKPQTADNKHLPVVKDGMPVMSMGFFVPPGEPIIWRGPMLHSAITQFLRDTLWGDLDYLIIDMPPGTGDVALTLSQVLPLTGAVVVCTPQEVALLDAVKAIGMFRKVNIPVLGMVENMSGFVCPGCDKKYDIFGSGGARQKAEELNMPFLGEVPIVMSIREHGDQGTTQANFDDSTTAAYLEGIAYRLVRNLADAAKEQPPQPQLPVLG